MMKFVNVEINVLCDKTGVVQEHTDDAMVQHAVQAAKQDITHGKTMTTK